MIRIPTSLRLSLVGLSVFALASCGDDPELVRKREEQRAEIRRLEGELAVLQEKMSDIPPDRSADLDKLKQEAEENKTRVASLEDEIADLEKEKQGVERELESYRRKYVIRGN